jgi:hypothetical protein
MSPASELRQDTTDALLDHVRRVRIAECAFLSGLGSAVDVGKLKHDYAEPAPIFSDNDQAASRHSNVDRLCSLSRLDFHIEREVEPLETQWSTLLERTIVVADNPMRYHDLIAAARTTNDRERREEFSLAIVETLNAGQVFKRDAWRRRLTLCRATGLGSYAAAYTEMKSHCVEVIISLAHEVLRGTQHIYECSLKNAIAVVNLDPGDISLEDMDWMLRSLGRSQRRGTVSVDRIMRSLLHRLAGKRAGAVRLDLAERFGKSTRPFAAPIDPPGDVRLSARPSGSLRDVAEGLHELGHACAFAYISCDATPVEKLLSWDDVQETYAFLTAGLAREPAFWKLILDYDEIEAADASSTTRLAELYLIRRYAAKTLFELQALSEEDVPDQADTIYDRLLHQATGIHQPAGRWLIDTDTSLTTLDYFEAWLIAAQWARTLATRYRDEWWLDEDALQEIRMVWMKGGAATKEVLLTVAGEQNIAADALIASFNS